MHEILARLPLTPPRIQEENGQTLVEYALLIALIGAVTIGILTGLGANLVIVFTSAANAL